MTIQTIAIVVGLVVVGFLGAKAVDQVDGDVGPGNDNSPGVTTCLETDPLCL